MLGIHRNELSHMIPEESGELFHTVVSKEDRDDTLKLNSNVVCHSSSPVKCANVAECVFYEVEAKLSRLIEYQIFADLGLMYKAALMPGGIVKEDKVFLVNRQVFNCSL